MPPITFVPPYTLFQPFPQFYIFRPDQRIVPLIALDELPSWLQVGNWDWTDPSLFQYMFPASLSQVTRLGEYDVICYHCCSNLDILHKSISQHSDLLNYNNDPNNPNANKENRGPSATGCKSFPGAYCTANREPCNAPVMATSYVHLAPLRQPPFNAIFHPQILGMYVADFQGAGPMQMDTSKHSDGTFRETTNPSSPDSSKHALLNPAAPEFSPATHAQSPVPRSPLTSSNYDTQVSSSDIPSSSNTSLYDASITLERNPNLDNPIGQVSFEVCLDDSGSASPSRSDSSRSSENVESLLEELQSALDSKDLRNPSTSTCEDYPPMPKSPRNTCPKLLGHDTKKRKRRRRRTVRPVFSRRPGRKRVVFKKRQGAATKRQKRRSN